MRSSVRLAANFIGLVILVTHECILAKLLNCESESCKHVCTFRQFHIVVMSACIVSACILLVWPLGQPDVAPNGEVVYPDLRFRRAPPARVLRSFAI